MDDRRFDSLIRLFAAPQTRRGTLGRVVAAAIALVIGATGDPGAISKRRKNRPRKRKHGRNRCPGQQTRCFGACTDTRSDRRNCGFCGKDCDDDETCINGECVAEIGPDRCPVEVCQVGVRNQAGICVYVNSPNNQIGPACTTNNRFCCNGSCCRQGDICLATGCCTPAANPCQGRCGTFTDPCGVVRQCGDCPQAVCRTITCNPQTHVCGQTIQPNLTPCQTASSQAGICCNGACIAAGQCCATGDCPNQTPCRPNLCQNNQCNRITEPDTTDCAPGDNGLPGICCGGICLGSAECCATSDCPAQTCRRTLCSDNICQYANLPNGQQGPGCMAPGQFCCGENWPDPAQCCNSGQTCSGATCSGT